MIELALGGDPTVQPGQRYAVLSLCRSPFITDEPSPLGAEPCMTIREAAEALGVSYRTVQRWTYSGALVSKRVMGRRYVPRPALRLMLGGHRPDAALPHSTGHRESGMDGIKKVG